MNQEEDQEWWWHRWHDERLLELRSQRDVDLNDSATEVDVVVVGPVGERTRVQILTLSRGDAADGNLKHEEGLRMFEPKPVVEEGSNPDSLSGTPVASYSDAAGKHSGPLVINV